MPTTVRPAKHGPREWRPSSQPATAAEDLLQGSCSKEHTRCKRVIQSSFSCGNLSPPPTPSTTSKPVYPTHNAFLSAVQDAYNQHHHLILRPEDVWFAILTQLSFYINAHATELADHFIVPTTTPHAGDQKRDFQKRDLVVINTGTVATVDFSQLIATRMTAEMSRNLTDPTLADWIMPDFSTTTQTDRVTAAVLMMGTMQSYFSYRATLTCGIPSVTLRGDRADWEDIRRRVDKLREFGDEAATFARLLVPVTERFVRSFDSADDVEVLDFWSKVADRRSGGSGPTYLSGWITAFCYWGEDGKPLYHVPTEDIHDYDDAGAGAGGGCVIDGVQYGRVDTDQIPVGFVGVPLMINDNGFEMETRMVAGSVGIAASSSGDSKLDRSTDHTYTKFNPFASKGQQVKVVEFTPQVDDDGTPGLDTIEPVTGWWMYEVGEDRVEPKQKQSMFKF